MRIKKAGMCFVFIAIVLLCVFAGWRRWKTAYSINHSAEKLDYKMMDKLINPALEIRGGLEDASTLLANKKELVIKPVSPKLDIDPKSASFFVTDSRGGSYGPLGYQDKETFLKDYGFDEVEPFYQYVDETSGELRMELYYDENTAKGCGIRYYPEEGRQAEGFVFNGSRIPSYREDEHLLRDRSKEEIYSKLTYDGYDPSQDECIEEFEEKTEYTADGKMKHYIATGWITYMSDEPDICTIVEMDFVYREDGSLQSMDSHHNQAYGGTWYSSVHSFYDSRERLVFEDCYITHGSMEYYYIYNGEEEEPSYYLVIDYNPSPYAEMISYHDIVEDADGKCYGKVGPNLSDNLYVRAVREANRDKKYSSDSVSHTYEMDYDGDWRREAFVIIGEYRDGLSGEPTEDLIDGSAWFVDSEKNVMYLDTATFKSYQEYLWQDGKSYLLLNHSVGLSWETDIFTVEENEPCQVLAE